MVRRHNRLLVAFHVVSDALLGLSAFIVAYAVLSASDGDADTLNELNDAVLRDVNQAGRVWLSNASVRGTAGLRACITNHRTTEQDVRRVVDEVLSAASRVTARTL